MKKVTLTILAMLAVAMAFPSLSVDAKVVRRLSTRQKTISVGQEYTLKLKGLSKKDKQSGKRVSWKISDKSVVVFKGKTKYGVTVRARNTGKVKVAGKYKGKKYSCRIRVVRTDGKSDEDTDRGETADVQSENRQAKLNASEIDLYYLAEEDKKYITPASGHRCSFQFKVSGVPKGEIIRWSIETGKKANCYHVSDGREVYLLIDPSNLDEASDAVLTAKLEDGTKLTAKLHGYSERGIAVKKP